MWLPFCLGFLILINMFKRGKCEERESGAKFAYDGNINNENLLGRNKIKKFI